jgi:hypothetical protein
MTVLTLVKDCMNSNLALGFCARNHIEFSLVVNFVDASDKERAFNDEVCSKDDSRYRTDRTES